MLQFSQNKPPMDELQKPGLSAEHESHQLPDPLASLLEALELLVTQARLYERVLPAQNYPARAAAAALGELAQQALNEAHELEASLQSQVAPGTRQDPAGGPFSPRESQVLALAARGMTNKEIAFRLGISERTVQFHLNSVFNKSGTQSRTQAVALAIRTGWLRGETNKDDTNAT